MNQKYAHREVSQERAQTRVRDEPALASPTRGLVSIIALCCAQRAQLALRILFFLYLFIFRSFLVVRFLGSPPSGGTHRGFRSFGLADRPIKSLLKILFGNMGIGMRVPGSVIL